MSALGQHKRYMLTCKLRSYSRRSARTTEKAKFLTKQLKCATSERIVLAVAQSSTNLIVNTKSAITSTAKQEQKKKQRETQLAANRNRFIDEFHN